MAQQARSDLTTVTSVIKGGGRERTEPPLLEDGDDDVVVQNPGVVVSDDMVNVRIRGSWEMIWGQDTYDFEDGRRYKIPRDLFNYLKVHRNIYDTM